VAPLLIRHPSEPKARLAFYREKAVGCSDIAPSLKVRSCFLSLAGIDEVKASVAHCFALVPKALHVAQDFDAPVLQTDGRERVVCAPRCSPCGRVCPLEIVEGGIAGSI
jgi:hypothetical protein